MEQPKPTEIVISEIGISNSENMLGIAIFFHELFLKLKIHTWLPCLNKLWVPTTPFSSRDVNLTTLISLVNGS
uniref:Uncharacterized protein n=1 Tax=Cannabis sativa TaxID=3483 RepID=A0A803QY87_CANSA